MAHKYLDDIGVTSNQDRWWFNDDQYPDDKRLNKWEMEREVYGFDDRETWDLQSSFYLWLYERLMKYVESASPIVNLEYHKFEYKGKEYTQIEMIDMMLERLKFFFSSSYVDFDPESEKKVQEIGEIWAIVLPAMWW